MGEENKTVPKQGQSRQSKFKFLIPDEKQILRTTSVDNKNITFNSNVDLTVQFETKGYDTQRYNIKKLVNERLYETQVFDISRISEAIVETINEIEEKGVESFKDLEVVDDYDFENNENYNRSLNILVTEVERKQYTEHVEIDEESFREQSEIIKNELERILRNNSSENVEYEQENTRENSSLETGTGFTILLADDHLENGTILDNFDESEYNTEYEATENITLNINLGGNVDIPMLDGFSEQQEALRDDRNTVERRVDNNYSVEQEKQNKNNERKPVKQLNHVYEEVRKPNLKEDVKTYIKDNTPADDLGSSKKHDLEERHYINFDNDDLERLDDDFEDALYSENIELKLLNDEDLEAFSERKFLTEKSVTTSKSTSFANNHTLNEEKRIEASKFFNEDEEYYIDTNDSVEVKNKVLMYIAIGLIGILLCVIVFFSVRIVMNIYESNTLGYEFGENSKGNSKETDTHVPVIEGVNSSYKAVVDIVSNNSSNDVIEITNESFIYDEASATSKYFDEAIYANTKNAESNYTVLFGKDDNGHFGSIKYLGDEDFFNTLKVNYTVENQTSEYTAIVYYKTKDLEPALSVKLKTEDLSEFLENEFGKSEHSKGITITSDSSILSLVTYDTQEKMYHVAHFIGN